MVLIVTEKADVVIKAQILAGGRGLGSFTNGFQGGVHIVTRYTGFQSVVENHWHAAKLCVVFFVAVPVLGKLATSPVRC